MNTNEWINQARPNAWAVDSGHPSLDALEAVLALNTGNNRKLYGPQFEAGMAKALWIVRQTIADKLGMEL